jgi:hypothetical protein
MVRFIGISFSSQARGEQRDRQLVTLLKPLLVSSSRIRPKTESASLHLNWSRDLGCVRTKDGDSGLRRFVVIEPKMRHLLTSSRYQLTEMSRGIRTPGLYLISQVSIRIEDRNAFSIVARCMGIA